MSIDALSLACNIITLIDFSHKFYETYRDISDNRKPDIDTQRSATELSKLTSKLKDSRKNASLPKNDQLDRVADQCLNAANKLQMEIAKIAPSNSSSRIGQRLHNLASASKRIWRHDRIEQMKKTMETCQRTMQDVVLVKMYESGQAEQLMRREEFAKLETRVQNFVQALSENRLQISDLLAENRTLHKETREVVRKEIVALRDAQVSDAQVSRFKASLKFPMINQRYNDVRPGHVQSFRWLLGEATMSDTDTSLHPEWHESYLRKQHSTTFGDFSQWLKSESGSDLYWISGKPGAGKSTIMKYLCQQMKDSKIVDKPYVVIHHFFWLGTSRSRSRQNDLEGMFSTILFQLLAVEVNPGTTLAAILLRRSPHLSEMDTYTDWCLEELRATVRKALAILSNQYFIYIILDALDEHLPAADHEELLAIIKELENTPGIRLVISSRRERIFERYLAHSRQLRLQDLTAADIHSFAADSLRPRVKATFDNDSSCKLLRYLVDTIVEKAQDVFLWTRLAVDSVKRGLVDGNPEYELRKRLDDLPSSLSDYFKSIWKRLGDDEKIYQTQAANIFSLLLCNIWHINPLCSPQRRRPEMTEYRSSDILTLSLALAPQVARSLIQVQSSIRGNELLKLCRHTQDMFLSHCAGLVELSSVDVTETEPHIHCRFIHRTVADFLREEGKEIVGSNNFGDANPDFRLMLAFLARCVAFREPGYDARTCAFLVEVDSELWFESARPENTVGSHLTADQRHSLIAMYHIIHYRFCGHPENPRFTEWSLTLDWYQIRPFVTEIASRGHTDYAMHWIDKKASGGSPLSPEALDLILKASLLGYVFRFNECARFSAWGSYVADEYVLKPPRPRLPEYPRILWKYANNPSLRLPCCCLVSSWAVDRETLIRVSKSRHLVSTTQLVLTGLLIYFNTVPTSRSQWPFSKLYADFMSRLLGLWTNLNPQFCERMTCIYQGHLPYFKDISDPRGFIHFDCIEMKVPNTCGPIEGVQIVLEVSPLWVIWWLAQILKTSLRDQTDKITETFLEFVSSAVQDGQEIGIPRPILLLGSDNELRDGPDLWDSEFNVDEMRMIPPAMADYLGEPLRARIDSVEQLKECHETLRKRVEEAWSDASTDLLEGQEQEEELVNRGIWCSTEEMERIVKACNIRMPCEGANNDRRATGRIVVPPNGCSEEEEAFSYMTMMF